MFDLESLDCLIKNVLCKFEEITTIDFKSVENIYAFAHK